MMKWMVLIPQSPFSPVILPRKTNCGATWPPSPVIESPSATFYPLHKSLEEEINRLFSSYQSAQLWGETSEKANRDVMEEFRHNGVKDTEYLSDEEHPKPVVGKRRKNKKPLPTECVFCKNNGEPAEFYQEHILKDSDGKILCPILRKYECPICGATGSNSHTLKYCPANPKPMAVSVVNTLKGMRNATGKKRSK